MLKFKKGQVMEQLQGFLLGLAGVAVILTVVLLTLGSLQTAADDSANYCGTGYTYNASQPESTACYNTSVTGGPVALSRTDAYTATGSIMTKLATVPTWVGIIIVVALAFIVMGFFYVRSQSQM